MAGRGALTEAVQVVAREKLGREISVRELRLMPYLMTCMMDCCNVRPNHINTEERQILMQWQADGYIVDPASDLNMTPEFWDVCQSIVWVGYCNWEAQ